jgi:hypothetical protein
MSAPDALIVLRSHSGALAKQYQADGKLRGFAAGAWFSVHERTVHRSVSWPRPCNG